LRRSAARETAGTAYLEALRVVARESPRLFGSISWSIARERFSKQIARLPHFREARRTCQRRDSLDGRTERLYLDEKLPAADSARHLRLSADARESARRAQLQGRILETLERYADLHKEVLTAHLGGTLLS
jgi:hypothetical protein